MEVDQKFSMKLQDYKHVEEPAQENNNYSKHQMVLGFELYLVVNSIPYLIPSVPFVILAVMGNIRLHDHPRKFRKCLDC